MQQLQDASERLDVPLPDLTRDAIDRGLPRLYKRLKDLKVDDSTGNRIISAHMKDVPVSTIWEQLDVGMSGRRSVNYPSKLSVSLPYDTVRVFSELNDKHNVRASVFRRWALELGMKDITRKARQVIDRRRKGHIRRA